MSATGVGRDGSRIRVLPMLRRRWWLLVLTTVATTAVAYAVTSLKEESHTAQALAVVPAGGGPNGSGSANDAETLASTYAALIPEDGRILRAVARATRLPLDDVEERVAAVNTSGTALLALRFQDARAERAVRGARALARAVDDGTSPNIRRKTIGLVRAASRPIEDSPGPAGAAGLLAGVLVGLFLGAVAMVFLERADPRGDDEREYEDGLGLPATALGRRSVGPQVPLVDRWAQLVSGAPARVAFVPATKRAARSAHQAAEALAEAACERGRYVAVEASVIAHEPALVAAHDGTLIEAPPEAMLLATAAGPGGDPSGESIGLSSDVVALVVRRGEPVAKARARLASLRSLGIEVERVLVAPRRMRIRTGGREPR